MIDLAGGATTSQRDLVRAFLPWFAAKLLTVAVFAEGGWIG